MRRGEDKEIKIPHFSSDEEAFEWYELHEMTDHLKDTEEVEPSSILYQDMEGKWVESSEAVLVLAQGITMELDRARLATTVRDVPIPICERQTKLITKKVLICAREDFDIEGEEEICTSTTHSSATMLKLETK